MEDLKAGFAMRRVWIALAGEDIDDQHRRTTLGPVWLLVNYVAFVLAFLLLFGRWGGSSNMAAYISLGLLIWFYIAEVIGQSATVFVREEAFIKGTRLPLSVYVFRATLQAVIRSSYALAGCIVIMLLLGTYPTIGWLWAFLAILIIIAVTPAVTIVVGIIGAYFPDMQFVISNLIRLGLFITPVFWTPDSSSAAHRAFYYLNPFTYFLEIVRTPIISGAVPIRSLLLCLGTTVFLWVLGLYLLGRFRKKIVFVL